MKKINRLLGIFLLGCFISQCSGFVHIYSAQHLQGNEFICIKAKLNDIQKPIYRSLPETYVAVEIFASKDCSLLKGMIVIIDEANLRKYKPIVGKESSYLYIADSFHIKYLVRPVDDTCAKRAKKIGLISGSMAILLMAFFKDKLPANIYKYLLLGSFGAAFASYSFYYYNVFRYGIRGVL